MQVARRGVLGKDT